MKARGDQHIEDFLSGRFVPGETGRPVECSIRTIVIEPDLDGAEAGLVERAGLDGRLAVVCDENTIEVMGRRVVRALGDVIEVVLDHPHADEETAADLRDRIRHADAVVAVGSGTINDLCKHATFPDGRQTAVFGTAASMNGYVTSTASISSGGYKNSLKSKAPAGVFFDLSVLSAAPARMTCAGVGDSLCRGVAQVDWLMSHRLLGTPYYNSPYVIQLDDEPLVLESTGRLLDGDPDAMAALVRLLTLGGLGVVISGTSHSGSMGEHGISHYIDMFMDPHPGSLHGEQVGVATFSMTRLQAEMLADEQPPMLEPTRVDEVALRARYGAQADDCIRGLMAKRIDDAAAARINGALARDWPGLRDELLALTLPLARLEAAVGACDGPMKPGDIGLDAARYGEAVAHAHEIRDRFSFLDLAAHTGRLAGFAEREAAR
ncbi:MAG: iron-containing alcohol dehydrogenase [Geminicoccaceae bacterium]|nr:iron-containing alcohol dehydrogenase [Geminicoccaceae bacterium]